MYHFTRCNRIILKRFSVCWCFVPVRLLPIHRPLGLYGLFCLRCTWLGLLPLLGATWSGEAEGPVKNLPIGTRPFTRALEAPLKLSSFVAQPRCRAIYRSEVRIFTSPQCRRRQKARLLPSPCRQTNYVAGGWR